MLRYSLFSRQAGEINLSDIAYLSVDQRNADGIVVHEAATETAKLVQLVYQRLHGEIVANPAFFPSSSDDTRRPYDWQPVLARFREFIVQTLKYHQLVLQQQAGVH